MKKDVIQKLTDAKNLLMQLIPDRGAKIEVSLDLNNLIRYVRKEVPDAASKPNITK